MKNAQTRIRQARVHAKVTQQELATLIGVHRSAVAQWERVGGTMPTLENLARVAISTSVQFEWLATGRGRMQLRSDILSLEDPVALLNYSAHDEWEARALAALRRMGHSDVTVLVEMLEALGRNRTAKLTRRIAYSR